VSKKEKLEVEKIT